VTSVKCDKFEVHNYSEVKVVSKDDCSAMIFNEHVNIHKQNVVSELIA